MNLNKSELLTLSLNNEMALVVYKIKSGLNLNKESEGSVFEKIQKQIKLNSDAEFKRLDEYQSVGSDFSGSVLTIMENVIPTNEDELIEVIAHPLFEAKVALNSLYEVKETLAENLYALVYDYFIDQVNENVEDDYYEYWGL